MRIRSLMVKNPISISLNASIQEALDTMKSHSIRHLPVVGQDRTLLGFLTLSDLKQGLLPSMLENLTLADLMIKKPIVMSPENDVEDAAQLIYRRKIGGMPIVENGKLVGIITVTDLLRAFIEMMGLLTASSRLDVEMGDDPDTFQEVSRILRQKGAQVISVGMEPLSGKRRIYHFRIVAANMEALKQAVIREGFRVTDTGD